MGDVEKRPPKPQEGGEEEPKNEKQESEKKGKVTGEAQHRRAGLRKTLEGMLVGTILTLPLGVTAQEPKDEKPKVEKKDTDKLILEIDQLIEKIDTPKENKETQRKRLVAQKTLEYFRKQCPPSPPELSKEPPSRTPPKKPELQKPEPKTYLIVEKDGKKITYPLRAILREPEKLTKTAHPSDVSIMVGPSIKIEVGEPGVNRVTVKAEEGGLQKEKFEALFEGKPAKVWLYIQAPEKKEQPPPPKAPKNLIRGPQWDTGEQFRWGGRTWRLESGNPDSYPFPSSLKGEFSIEKDLHIRLRDERGSIWVEGRRQ
jgi:hypothetical protein